MENTKVCGLCTRPYVEHCSSCYACPGGRHDEYCGTGDDLNGDEGP